jgi:DNA-binding response OmpR family regulator
VSTAAAAVAGRSYDAVLLDPFPPADDSLAVCRRLRRDSEIGIIIVTARAGVRDRVLGLRAGADDYLAKPFALPELHARLEAVLRRSRRRERRIVLGNMIVDLDGRCAVVGGSPVKLTDKEFDLLAVLARTPEVTVSRHRLVAEVWRTRPGPSRTLDVHISTLRSKIKHAASLECVHGVGYRLRAPTEQPAAALPVSPPQTPGH